MKNTFDKRQRFTIAEVREPATPNHRIDFFLSFTLNLGVENHGQQKYKQGWWGLSSNVSTMFHFSEWGRVTYSLCTSGIQTRRGTLNMFYSDSIIRFAALELVKLRCQEALRRRSFLLYKRMNLSLCETRAISIQRTTDHLVLDFIVRVLVKLCDILLCTFREISVMSSGEPWWEMSYCKWFRPVSYIFH